MDSQVLTVKIPPQLQQKLDAMATKMERSQLWLVRRAIEDFLALQEWQVQAIQEGIEAADRGEFASDQEVKRVFQKYQQ